MNTGTARIFCTYRKILPGDRKVVQMKKSIILLCLLCLLLGGCGAQTPPDISLEDVFAANTTEAILSRYKSFNLVADGSIRSRFYADHEMYLVEKGDTYRELVGDDYLFVWEEGEYYGYILADGGAYRESFESMVLLPDMTTETVIDITSGRDGIVLTTQSNSEVTKKHLENSFGMEYKSGDCFEWVYTLDPSDLTLTHFAMRLVHADGTDELNTELQLEYDVDRPDWAQEMIDRCLPENDVRTLTVVLDPNTGKEQVYTRSVRKGDSFYVVLPEGYVLYTDEACTIPAEEMDDSDSHVLRFAKKAEQK